MRKKIRGKEKGDETETMKQLNVGFSIHRPEMVPVTAMLMEKHAVIFLEEPPAPDFEKMLNGIVSVADSSGFFASSGIAEGSFVSASIQPRRQVNPAVRLSSGCGG